MTSHVRDAVLAVDEYTLRQHPFRIKLNQNENPFELPQEVKDEILKRVGAMSWSRYPAFAPEDQIKHVAKFAGWAPEGTLLGNGSNELLQLLCTCLLDSSRSVVLSQPTFTLYKILARSVGAEVVEVPMREGFRFDVPRLIDATNRSRADLLILCSPNNPTGTWLSRQELKTIIDGTTAQIVLDEAYMHFAPESLADMLSTTDRLVVLQTFSKAMGAAGLRFGYALASPELARQMNKVKLPYNVNIFTLVAVDVLLEQWERIRGWIETLVLERERLRSRMKGLEGIKTYKSAANFLLFETLNRTPGEIFTSLREKGILIRDVSSYPQLSRGLRVSVGSPEQNDEFFTTLSGAL